MTKKEMFNTIATINADNAEIVEFCRREIELLDNRKASHSLSKTQKENVEVKEWIVDALCAIGHPVTVTELIGASAKLCGFSNQKISALLSQLCEAKAVTKTFEKKKALFSVC